MRMLLSIGVLAAIGCSHEYDLQYRSTVITESNGVAMSDDGLTSYAAMGGLTCALDVRWGCPTIEDDLPSDEERVLDHLDGTTLARSEAKLHFLDGGTWDPDRDLDEPALRTARLSDAGLLVLRGDDTACMLDVGDATTEVDAGLCSAAGYEVDRSGALVAVTDQGILRVDGSGVTTLADHGDRTAVDRSRDLVYVATAGEAVVSAYDLSGSERWSLDVDHVVRDVAARGDKGDMVLLVEDDDGLGLIEFRDGETGEVKAIGRVPAAVGDLAVSANGRGLALVTDGEIHHFEIVVEGEPMPIGDDVTCPDLPLVQSPGVGFD